MSDLDRLKSAGIVSNSTAPSPSDEVLRNRIAALLAEVVWDGVRLGETYTQALADHLIGHGSVEGTWAGSRREPFVVHAFRLTVDEFLAKES